MRILIIEDEKLTARDLSRTIHAIEPSAEILPFITSVEDAVFFFRQAHEVDLIFSDIELGDGLSFDIFDQCQVKTPVIFCTAYEQYTLKAFKHFGIDYILKPFQKSYIENALLKFQDLKASFTHQRNNYQEVATYLQEANPVKSKSVLVRQADKIIPIHEKEIAFFFIQNELVYAVSFTQKRFILSEKLEDLEKMFPHFFRANRQYLLNRKAIKDVSQYFNRKLLVNLSFSYPDPIVVSRLKVPHFLKWLATNPNE